MVFYVLGVYIKYEAVQRLNGLIINIKADIMWVHLSQQFYYIIESTHNSIIVT